MSPHDEETVERYVRYPETLSEAERLRVADMLRADTVARRLAAFYRSFYDELDGLAPPADGRTSGRPTGRNEDSGLNESAAPDKPD